MVSHNWIVARILQRSGLNMALNGFAVTINRDIKVVDIIHALTFSALENMRTSCTFFRRTFARL